MDNDKYLEVQTKDCSLEAVLVLDYWVVPQCVRIRLRRKSQSVVEIATVFNCNKYALYSNTYAVFVLSMRLYSFYPPQTQLPPACY